MPAPGPRATWTRQAFHPLILSPPLHHTSQDELEAAAKDSAAAKDQNSHQPAPQKAVQSSKAGAGLRIEGGGGGGYCRCTCTSWLLPFARAAESGCQQCAWQQNGCERCVGREGRR